MKTAIIGGGITGLSLAYFLSKKGRKVTVFEKTAELGGLAATFPFENTRLEKFYHHLFSTDREIFQLIFELGLFPDLTWARSSMGFYTGGRIHPFTSPLDLMRFPAISFSSRIKLGLLSVKSKGLKDWEQLSRVRAKDWLIGEIGEEAYRVVWEPLLFSKFGKHHENVPASWVGARLNARARSRGLFSERLGYLRGSFQVLVDALAGSIKKAGGEILLGSPVEKLADLSSFDKIIFTLAPPLVAKIANIGEPVKYVGNICMVLETEDKISDYYWTNIGERDFSFCAMIEHHNAFHDRDYNGKRAVYLSNYLDQDDPLWGGKDEDVLKAYLKDLKRIKPNFTFINYWVFRELYAQPVVGLNYKIPQFEIQPGRVYMVNNAQIYPQDRGLNDSLKLARKFSDII
jgi:protoporphyrinogen oxidase